MNRLAGVGSPSVLRSYLGTPATTKKVRGPGTHRTRTIADTLQRTRTCLQPAGISRVSDLTGLDTTGIPVFAAVRPDAAPGSISVLGGKGVDADAARASAILEAIERHCGERQGRAGPRGTPDDVRDSFPDHVIVDPSSLILRSDSTFSDSDSLEWYPATDLLTGEDCMLPATAVFTPYTDPPLLFASSSNGLASGNILPEATLHGLLEVIERDATAFGELTGRGPSLDLSTVSSTNREIVEAFAAAGLAISVRVFATEYGIPTFYAILDDVEREDPLLINGGFGCHLDPQVGLTRALTEAALSRTTVLAGAREDLADEGPKRVIGYDRLKAAFAEWFTPRVAVSMASFEDWATTNIHDDLLTLLEQLERAGVSRVLAVDLSRPEVGAFSVVRVVVPGAELAHIDRLRIGPRLRSSLQGRRS